MRRVLFSILFIISTFTTFVSASNQKAIIIFDASGSMWGQINGVPKINIAKDALKKVIKSWDPNIELGLTVYGHRRKGDCNDIESVVPVGAIDKERIVKSVMAISPKGKTPISRSLKIAADELKITEDKATVILISDGKETCDPNPCDTAKKLKQQGIDFVAHVIGFNVDKTTDKQLQCIANATGGEYFSAKNADALNSAMKTIVKKVQKPKKLEFNLQITASETKDSPKVEALHYIYKDGSKKYTQVCESKKNSPCLEHVVPGKYNIVTSYHHYKVKTPVEVISEANLTNVNVITGQTGEAKIFASETNRGKWVKSFHIIYKNIDEKKGENTITSCDSGKREPCIKRLPIGKYIAESSYGKYKTYTSFEIKANKTTDVAVIFKQTGKVEVTASEKEGGKLIKANCKAYKIIDGEVDDSSWDYLGTNKREPRRKRLQIGKYILKCKYNEYKKEIPFEIKAGETTKVHVILGQTGKVYVSASEKEDGKWLNANCYIYNEDKSHHWNIYPRKDKESSMWYKQLPVGKYTLDCEYNAFKKKDIPFEIKAGEDTKVHIIFGQTGKVYVSASEKEGGKWINANCNIYDEAKDKSWVVYPRKYKSTSMSQRQLPVGKYYLNCSYNDFKKEDIPFEIKAGETTKIHIVFPHIYLKSKCLKPNDRVNYEIYETSGASVYDRTKPCSKKIKVTLNEGEYNIEGKVKDVKATAKVEVSAKEPKSVVLDFTKQNHEAEIKADTPTQESQTAKKPQSSKRDENAQITIEGNKIEVKGISKDEIKKLEQMGKALEQLGGMVKTITGNNPEQKEKNKKADKEFEKMSKELDMFTK